MKRFLQVWVGLVAMVAGAQAQGHVFFRVTLTAKAPGPVSGRVLVFLKQGKGDKEVDAEEFHPGATWVTSKEVHDLTPGASVEVDGADVSQGMAFPESFARMPAGEWEAQAVLDPEHSYNLRGRSAEDWVSSVASLGQYQAGASSEPVLTLDAHPAIDPRLTAATQQAMVLVKAGLIEKEELESAVLTKFWGRPTVVRAWVVLPPGYKEHPEQRYPTVYWTAGFGGPSEYGLMQGARLRERMVKGMMPPMIWVMLDESCVHGAHEFADSVNNGPWGTALTTEFIPSIEKKYRMDGRASGRFLNGHSSGGWATLQLQVNYPQVFGGTWSTSPDPSDFHNFTGPNLYRPDANVYHRPDGEAYPIMRMDGKAVATLQQFAQLEDVIGPYGGQIRSFDWVFSPKSDAGGAEPMFDHATGAVNPAVVAYWGEHWDLANLVERKWGAKSTLLQGRIHLYVGTADTFYLDGAAHLFEARLTKLGAGSQFHYLAGRTHFDLYGVGEDPMGLFDSIAKEMYAVARPGLK